MCQISRSFSTCIRFRWHFPFFYMSISRCGNQILHFWMNIPGNNWTMRSYNAEKCELILFSNLSGCSVFSPFCFGTSSIKDDTLDSIGVCCIMVWDSFFCRKIIVYEMNTMEFVCDHNISSECRKKRRRNENGLTNGKSMRMMFALRTQFSIHILVHYSLQFLLLWLFVRTEHCHRHHQ